MSENRVQLGEVRIEGRGSFSLPDGMTQEEADRLVAEADERRRAAEQEG